MVLRCGLKDEETEFLKRKNGFVCPQVWTYELFGGLTRNLVRTLRYLGCCSVLGFQFPNTGNRNAAETRIYGSGATLVQLLRFGNHGSIWEVRGHSSNRKYVETYVGNGIYILMKFPYSMKRFQNVKVQTVRVRTVHSGADYCFGTDGWRLIYVH